MVTFQSSPLYLFFRSIPLPTTVRRVRCTSGCELYDGRVVTGLIKGWSSRLHANGIDRRARTGVIAEGARGAMHGSCAVAEDAEVFVVLPAFAHLARDCCCCRCVAGARSVSPAAFKALLAPFSRSRASLLAMFSTHHRTQLCITCGRSDEDVI